jgi:ribonuclease HI
MGSPVGILQCHPGLATKYSIWEAEVAGVLMALWMLRGSNRISHLPISIYSDSQAILRVIRTQGEIPGYHLIEKITRLAESLVQRVDSSSQPHIIKSKWIAAHKEVQDNKKVDKEAKKVAMGDSTPGECHPNLLGSLLPSSIGISKHQFLMKL